MVMDPAFWQNYKSMNANTVHDFNLETSFIDSSTSPPLPPDLGFGSLAMSNDVVQQDHHEDYDFSDVVLKYISQMLMEEDVEDRSCLYQESSALQETEKSLYEAIGEEYPPPSRETDLTTFVDQFLNIPDGTNDSMTKPEKNFDTGERDFALVPHQTNSQSSFSSSNNHGTSSSDRFIDSPMSILRVPDISYENEFNRGLKMAKTFIPKTLEDEKISFKVEENHGSDYLNRDSKGKKNRHVKDVESDEGRSAKQSATYVEATVRSEMFDLVLLCNGGKSESALREALQNETNKTLQQNGQVKGSKSGKGRGKKTSGKKDIVDLRSLLTLCAQAVASNDLRTAYDFLKQIRQHSSPIGDGMQRISHYFANGLEARLAGSRTRIQASFMLWETSASDILKAYHLFLAVCPFKKLSNFFSNKTIMEVSEKATKLHIIDFGILYGFQWPCLIQRLSTRVGGGPMLRITGIDFPQPGFRPARRVEETERRLKNYAETFNVPFEFNGIAQNWETIQIEDLKIKNDEIVVVNSMYRFRSLPDETVMVESPRNIVLNLIKKINPTVFIQGVVNGAYGAPFFLTRFREALFHFSTLFDMLEANVPSEIEERSLLEKEVFGREAINVIACEGSDRIERPETYKQWQVRNRRAGFMQLPLNEEMMKMAKERVKTCYHKDFLIDEDGRWMIQGWKGRIMYAISSWRLA